MADPVTRDPVTSNDDAMLAGATKTGAVGVDLGGTAAAAGAAVAGTTVGGVSGDVGSSPVGGSTAGTPDSDALAARGGVAPRAAGTDQPLRGAHIVGDQTSDHDGPGPRLMTADTLIGNQVVNHQGDTLGEIEDIMLDVPNGRIAYAVMVAGGFLGMGEKMFALPWSALTLDTTRKCFLLDADKQHIQNAPGFDRDHWPSQADRQWQAEVHSYYHARPYYDE